MFKVLPDAVIAWADALVGAALTAVLFAVGKFGIGLYLSHSDVGGAYGSAGGIVVLLVWVYYSALILLLGAELTQVGRRIARPPDPAARARDAARKRRRPQRTERPDYTPDHRRHRPRVAREWHAGRDWSVAIGAIPRIHQEIAMNQCIDISP